MPQEIFIPSKGKTLTFADDFSDQEIADYIDANFPRSGEDVAYDLKNRLLDPEWNPSYEDFEKLRKYNTEKDINTAEVVRNIAGGIVEMGGNLLKAIPAAVSDPTAIPGSAARGLVNNLKTYSMLAQGGVDPGSPLFNMMNGDSITAYSTWRDSILAARDLAETSNAAIGGMPVNPQQVAGAEVVMDPLNIPFVPGLSVAGKVGAKAAGAVGRTAELAGRGVAQIASVPERAMAKAATVLAGVPEDVARASAADLATKGAILDAAAGVVPGAFELQAAKRGGQALEAAGEAVGAAARAAEAPAGMLSPIEVALQNPELSKGARAILTVTQRIIPRDAALVAGTAAEGALIGGALGGGLGALQSTDEEEIGKAIGGGIAAGTMISGGLKLYDVATGKVAKERVVNDASRNIAEAAARGETEAELAGRAELFDRLSNMDRKGNALGTFIAVDNLISQRGGKTKIVDGDVLKGPGGETGWNAYYDPKDKTIYINSKSADATTIPHEATHAFISDLLADDITSRLFTRDSDGRLQPTSEGTISRLIDGYLKDADNIKLSDGTTEGQRLRERLDSAFDPATPISEQVSRLRDITHEIAARYSEEWIAKKNPRDLVQGTMPTIWSEAITAVRGKLDKTFGKETGNPILDPVLKRIFDPKESGVPAREGVTLDPRALAYDWADKRGAFMTRYSVGSPAPGRKHWRPVFKEVKQTLVDNGAQKPDNAYYSKNNLSLLGVGEDVINSLTTRNIETQLRSSAPIVGTREAEIINKAIRAAKSGEMLDMRDYMSFLYEGSAESGKARQGNPLDKQIAVIDVFWNKDNGVQILAMDIGSAMSNLAKAVKSRGEASGFDSIAKAQKALNQYIKHVADSESNFDAAKKGWEIEVDGVPIGRQAHKTLHQALNLPNAAKDAPPPFRTDIDISRSGLNRISGVEFILPRRVTGQVIETGISTPISNKGVSAIRRRFQPKRTQVEQLPNGMVAQDADGARIVKTDTSGYRLFDPLGEKIGVFRTLDAAAEAASNQAAKDLSTVKEIQYAIQEQRAKEISVRQRTLYREAVRQGDAQGQEVARARFQPQKEEVFDQVAVANKTARAAGAVGDQAVTVQWLSRNLSPNESVLNFGAGRPDKSGKYGHSEALRKAGATVSEYDFGQNAVGALGGQYDTVMASNVLNVQGSVEMLKETISQMASEARPGGRIVFNYPDSPRHLDNLESRYKAAKKAGNETEASALRKEKNATTGEVARVIEEVTGVEPRKVGGTSKEPIWEVRFQPKKRKADRQPARTAEELAKMEAGILASAKRKADAQAYEIRTRIEGRGTGNLETERMAAMDAQVREAELFAKPKRAALSDQEIESIRQAGATKTYVEALLGFEQAYTDITGQPPAGKIYRENAMKMTKRQQDSILRLAVSSDLPQAKLAIEAAREAADPSARAAIEKMVLAEDVANQRQSEASARMQNVQSAIREAQAAERFSRQVKSKNASIEAMKPTLREMRKSAPKETVEPAAQPPTIKDVLQKKREVKKASEDAIAALKKRAEEEIAKIRQETEAKLVEAEKNVTAETTKVSAEIAEQFKALKKEIAVADEVISSETEAIKPSRIILKIKGKYRLYGVNAGLIGVFRTKEEAIKRGKK